MHKFNKKSFQLNIFALAIAVLVSTKTWAEESALDRVVAVVNNDVITQQELDTRFQFILRQNKFNISRAQQKSLYRKLLGDMVNEKVQAQYAKKRKINVTDKEIELAIATLERNNNLSKGGFYNLASGIEDAAKAKIKADLIWQKIITRHIRPRVIVSTKEVDRLIENLVANAKSTEKELQHIFIPVDGTGDKEEEQISEIYAQLKDDASQFDALAVSFDSNKKGYLGWFSEGELTPALEKAVKNMRKGTFSKPIQTSSGWHIVKVKDMRQTEKFETEPYNEYKVHALIVNKNENTDNGDILKALNNLETLGDMREYMLKNESIVDPKSGERAWMRAEKLPSHIQNVSLESGNMLAAHEGEKTISVYYVDDVREQLPEKLRNYRARMQERLATTRTNLTARRFLRDLRRAAFVDIRL